MQNVERRIVALENRASIDDWPKFIIVRMGETKAEARRREGYGPDAANVRYVLFISQTDTSV